VRWLRGVAGALLGLAVLGSIAAGGAGYVAYRRFSTGLPDVDGLRTYQPRVMSRVYTDNLRLLTEFATERRIFVPYAAIPDIVKRAFVAAEDQNFFTHPGVDPVAMLRAAATDALHYGDGRRPIGASTITQQVAKNMLLGNEVSLARKVKEVLLALRIEKALSKDHILELYLNEIYLGLSSYGVAAASLAYFDKPLDQLSVPEAAFLAALPKAPNNYNPYRFPDAAKARRDWVLDRMAETHAITSEQAQAAKATPLAPAPFHRPDAVPGGAYFAEEVRRQLTEKMFGEEQTMQGGLVVHTSLDPALQLAADRALHDGLLRYDQQHGGWRGPVTRLPAGPGLRVNWANQLGALAHPPGMLPDWRLAVVLEESDGEARLGFLEHPAGGVAAVARVLPVLERSVLGTNVLSGAVPAQQRLDTTRLDEGLAGLEDAHKDLTVQLRNQSLELKNQSAELKFLQEQVGWLGKSLDKHAQRQEEIAESIASLRRLALTWALVGVMLLATLIAVDFLKPTFLK